MDFKEHTTPDKLERYAFFWSLARMVIAAVSLFFGASPVYYKVAGMSSSGSLLTIAWIISGVASVYLAYVWFQNDKKVLGNNQKSTILFIVMVVTGINLGWTGLAGNNVGMSMVGYDAGIIFKVTAIVYLFVAYSLWTAWKANGETLFGASGPEVVSSGEVNAKPTQSSEVSTPELQPGESDSSEVQTEK